MTRTERLEEYQKTAAKDKTPAKKVGKKSTPRRESESEFDPTAYKVAFRCA